MKIVVIGAGLAGITSAYFLNRRGHEVVVLERSDGVARETSFANGGMLTPGMCTPWNAPGVWRVLLASLGRSDAALQLRLGTLPRLLGWGMTFLRNSSAPSFARNHLSNLRLAMNSLELMHELREHDQIDYGHAARGSLGIFRDERSLAGACTAASGLAAAGLRFHKLSTAQLVDLEPALEAIAHRLSGAIHYESDEVGDAHQFCVALAERGRQEGVQFLFDTEVAALEMRTDPATGARNHVLSATGGGKTFSADRYVIAAGSYSPLLLRHAGIRLLVVPAKGYSVTFDNGCDRVRLRRPIIDHHRHAVIVPFENGALRAAGTAEFAGYDRTLSRARVRALLSFMQDLLPQVRWDPAAAKAWCGLRPSSADGVAVIGPTPVPNLWVNTGQGHLGWTMAAGSARLLTDLICGDAPRIDPKPYAIGRFLPGD
jgi:D-amino-acid dehydrogenase